MLTYLIRIEAVNFDTTVYDTQDLSTIRGSSLTILNAARHLPTYLEAAGGKPEVNGSQALHAYGASMGVCKFTLPSAVSDAQKQSSDPAILRENIRLQVEEKLRDDYPQATFVVDIVPCANDDDESNLLAQGRTANRWRQFQQLTLVPPKPWTETHYRSAADRKDEAIKKRSDCPIIEMPAAGMPCEVDFVRPACYLSSRSADAADWVSESVFTRRERGRELRQSFYRDELSAGQSHAKAIDDLERLGESWGADTTGFAYHFEHISSRSHYGVVSDTDDKSHLDKKLAVICIDGQRQSELVAHAPLPTYRCFREAIRANHREVLEKLLRIVLQDASAWPEQQLAKTDWFFDGEDEQGKNQLLTRLETLLWGGDDIIWVVPAWQGWRVVDLFFDCAKNWQWQNKPLHYSAGLVFCHHNAPISRILETAWQLVGAGRSPEPGHFLAYEVLESFDAISTELATHRRERLGVSNALAEDPLKVSERELGQLADFTIALREEARLGDLISRRSLERMVRSFHQTPIPSWEDDLGLSDMIKQLAYHARSQKLQLSARQLLDSDPIRQRAWFLHAATLWDYLFPYNNKTGENT